MACVAALTPPAYLAWGALTMHGLEPTTGLLVGAVLLPVMIPVWLPSLVIASGLRRGRRWAVPAAFSHDGLVLLVGAGALTWMLRASLDESNDLAEILPYTSGAALLASLFAADAAYLLRTAKGWRPAWGVFAIIAMILLTPALAGPVAFNVHQQREVQPLLAYARGHWFEIPPGSQITALRLAAIEPDSDHGDRVTVQTQNAEWTIAADHRRDGRWRFPPVRLTGRTPPVWIVASCHVNVPVGVLTPLASADDARKLLALAGVTDTHLGTGQAAKWDWWECYVFWSPKARGSYLVEKLTGQNIQLHMEQALVVP